MAFPLAVVQGALMGVAVNAFTNVINDRSPFDNALQSLLLGGVSGGIFGGAEGAVPFGESTLAGNMSNLFGGAGSAAAGVGKGVAGATLDATSNVIPAQNLAVSSGNAAVDTLARTANPIAGMSDNNFGFNNFTVPNQETYLNNENFLSDPDAALQSRDYALLQQKQGLIPPPPVQAEPIVGTDVLADPSKSGLQPSRGNDFAKSSQGLSGGPGYVVPQTVDYLNAQPTFNKINNLYTPPSATPTATASPKFLDKPWEYLTHKDNRLQAAGVALGGLKLAGAFNPKTGLNNLPPRTYQRVNTSYNPGTVNPKYGMPGEPYFVGQGYGPQTRETFSVAAGGGIRALSGGGETAPYMPMTARGQMSWREDVPTDLDDSAAFKRYLKSDINKKEEKGQAEIDANVMAWLKKYSENTQHAAMGGPIDGRTYQQSGNRFAEGGGLNQPQQVTQFQPTYSPAQQGIGSLQSYQAPNVPAMESSPEPQYQMNGFSDNSLFQPTGSGGMTNYQPQQQQAQTYQQPNMTMPPGIAEYIANMNNIKPPNTNAPITPPAPVAAPVVANTTSPTIYDSATQTYSANPNIPAPTPAPAAETDPNDTGSWGLLSGSGEDAHYGYTGPGGATNGQWVGGGFDDNGGRIPGVWTPFGSTDDSNNQEKAGGPIKSQKYAMGGLAALPEYAAGGRLLSGDGDGMSDSIPAVIKGERPQRAALADGEFVIPADVVSHLGNGSTKAGGKRLYEMMANIRKARTGNSKQGKQINPMKFIPA